MSIYPDFIVGAMAIAVFWDGLNSDRLFDTSLIDEHSQSLTLDRVSWIV